jgi:hypothetical protein
MAAKNKTELRIAPTLVAIFLLCTFAGLGEARAQSHPLAASETHSSQERRSTSVERGKYAVIVDLDANELHFTQGDDTLWSAPIGTGSALRLESEDGSWDFSTPRGSFQVQYKELNPTWIAPDWFFIENGLPVPPPESPKRRFPGGLGAAAMYIGHDLAIHGTDKPELLGQRVSHGCIRLSDENALRLFHDVQTGTEVIIVGGEHIASRTVRPGENESTFTPGKVKPTPRDSVLEAWKEMDSRALLDELDAELRLSEQGTELSRWTRVAHLLIERGLSGDAEALRGMMTRVPELPTRRIECEYATFLADAYARGALMTLGAMAELEPELRDRIASMIVDATLRLYPGNPDDRLTPWPTRRVPRSIVGDSQRSGWNALARAEQEYRRRFEQPVGRADRRVFPTK